MFVWRFRKLISTLQFRVEQEGRKDPAWVLGFVEGLGKRKLTGYQAGALIHLLLCGELPPGMFRQEGRNGASLMIKESVGKVSGERKEVSEDGSYGSGIDDGKWD